MYYSSIPPSYLGKLAQSDHFNYTYFTNNYQELVDIYFSKSKLIRGFMPFSDFLMYVLFLLLLLKIKYHLRTHFFVHFDPFRLEIENLDDYVPAALDTYLISNAIVTSQAR